MTLPFNVMTFAKSHFGLYLNTLEQNIAIYILTEGSSGQGFGEIKNIQWFT